MKDDALLTILEQTAEKLSIKLDYDDIRKGDVVSYGDTFILRGERHILIDKKLNDREKGELLVEILAKFDTEDVHLPPEVRTKIDREKERERERAEKARESDETSEAVKAEDNEKEEANAGDTTP
ncbi:MAG: hypothetical protein IME98_02335 [Proteobacteria bacterium]|nr:hypothetical protein [Pseudomonadota bacterium]